MSCFTTSATRRSRIVPAAVLIASAAASSHDVLLVPMTSVTRYTLMTLSSPVLPTRAHQDNWSTSGLKAGPGRAVPFYPRPEPGTLLRRRPGPSRCAGRPGSAGPRDHLLKELQCHGREGMPGDIVRHVQPVAIREATGVAVGLPELAGCVKLTAGAGTQPHEQICSRVDVVEQRGCGLGILGVGGCAFHQLVLDIQVIGVPAAPHEPCLGELLEPFAVRGPGSRQIEPGTGDVFQPVPVQQLCRQPAIPYRV